VTEGMSKELLQKFVKLMEKDPLREEDLELIALGKALGLDLEPLSKLRASQEGAFTASIRDQALKLMENKELNTLDNDHSFYSGSIDFMVRKKNGRLEFFLLETNGGSHRGLSILTKKQQELIYQGYFGAIKQAIERKNQSNNKILIVVGVPVNDGLIHEKALLINYLRREIKKEDLSVDIFNIYTYNSDFTADVAFIIADYKQLSSKLSFKNKWVKFQKDKANILIGDGIARRIEDEKFKELIRKDFQKIKTLIVNPVYLTTDDKSLSYLAKHLINDQLEPYNIAKFLFTKAFNGEDLLDKSKLALQKYEAPFVIKPHAGSGGAGVMPIFPDYMKMGNSKIRKVISKSEKEFFAKFMKSRNPYPYTLQEMVNFYLIDWGGGKHTYDLRIYLSQINKKIIPVGGLARIARGIFENGLNKEEFVVNLSGYDGRIEVERGLGLSEKASELLKLNYNNFVDLFCNSCIIFKSIAENFQKIIDFSEWDQIIGSKYRI
jgi:hypothetical protein